MEDAGGDVIPEVVIEVPEEGGSSSQVDSQEEVRKPEEGPLCPPDDEGRMRS